jgi:DNA ligase-1
MMTKPMLAKAFDDPNVLTYPLYAQPKLDGVRAMWDGHDFWARPRPSGVRHKLTPCTDLLLRMRSYYATPLDGELYVHGLPLEDVVSRAKTGGEVEFHIFDLPTDEPFYKRWETLTRFVRVDEHVRLVKTDLLRSAAEVEEHMEVMLGTGYEGQILRVADASYEERRTSSLLKRKSYFEAKAIVIGVEPGKGKHEGRMGALHISGEVALWECRVGTGFSDAQREEVWLVGDRVEIGYQRLSKYGTPYAPRFVGRVSGYATKVAEGDALC